MSAWNLRRLAVPAGYAFEQQGVRQKVTFTDDLSPFNRDFVLFLEAIRKANPLASVDWASIRF
ncbi:hypothetical protein C7E15_03450 [Stenotrophomonas maltophilia]|uniref:hypothetical protein n=1 Tax=Stenotrophomonas maltophilia group TaxID=995085 RepID=UPI000D4CC676|nr:MULTISPECIES: hypothetical protein [Stenotrophomonas maltophilia group]MCF3497820.1 hypothetical protein [Stenotrophomonas maltophilia]MDQ4680682.1 hypothetical protein [Stenotrophomonas maltophilia group sp. RNC7]PSD20853.1 hypothetical protein C7E15_03450 [Stenotrophomonas maltophilia]UGB23328.1 hypothetical protein LQ335_08850 [Stenotrophomonas maltophilia]